MVRDLPHAPRIKRQVGGMVAVAVTTGTGVLDLTKLLAQAQNLATNGGRQAGGIDGQFITIEADGADVGIVFGKAIADVTAGNAPSLTAVGTKCDASGIYTDAAGICFRIPSGQNISVRPRAQDGPVSRLRRLGRGHSSHLPKQPARQREQPITS